jgi:hypothetical protein
MLFQGLKENAVFLDVMPFVSYKRQRFGDVICANIPSSLILFTLMMYAICSSESLVFARATRGHTTEDGILLNHQSENLNSYSLMRTENYSI